MEVDEFVTAILNATKTGQWVVISNLQLISPSQSTELLKKLFQTIDNPYISNRFKIWVLYNQSRNTSSKLFKIANPHYSQSQNLQRPAFSSALDDIKKDLI